MYLIFRVASIGKALIHQGLNDTMNATREKVGKLERAKCMCKENDYS